MKARTRQSVYVLTAFSIRENAESMPALAEDGVSVKLRQTQCGVFTSVRRAEYAIKKIVKANASAVSAGWESFHYFGFTLVEHYADDAFYGGDNVCTFRSFRSYLPDGTLNYFSDTDDACEKKFKGTRTASKLSAGQFAWILCGDRATPTLVEAVPYTREEWKVKMKKGVYGDFTDDSGIDFPARGGGHDHNFAPLLFPENGELCISDKAKSDMKAARRNWLNYGIG